MLKPLLLLSAVVLFVTAPVLTPVLSAAGTPQDAPKSTPASRDKAKEIYKVDCAMCHGDNGNGKTDLATSMQLTLTDWTDTKSLAGTSDKDLFDLIRKGKGDKMPPEDSSRAKDDEIWALVAYIRGFSKGAQ
jgi:mono/diheme cytochrome c family protein